MPLGCGMSCVKYLLFGFNLLFAITGLIVFIVGVYAEINSHPYIDLTDENFYTSAPIVLIIVGIIVFIVAFFGCCGAGFENHCMIVTFSVFLLLIFVAELVVGVASYVKYDDLESSIVRHLNGTIKEYNTDPAVKDAFNIMQTDLYCCGIYGPADWVNNNLPIPDSCCGARELTAGGLPAPCAPASPALHSSGCLGELVAYMNRILDLLGGIGLGIAIIQVLGVILACCLARSMRSQYETV